MLRDLLNENTGGNQKRLTDDHLEAIFDVVAHEELSIEQIKRISHEMGGGEDYDRSAGGAYFAIMRMYIVVHGCPPDGDIVGTWWKGVPPGFLDFAETKGIHDPKGNVARAGGIAEHKQKEAHVAKHAEKAGKAHASSLRKAEVEFNNRWKTIKITISDKAAKKAVEQGKEEILNDMVAGTPIHRAIEKVVTAHGGVMEGTNITFVNYLIEQTKTTVRS